VSDLHISQVTDEFGQAIALNQVSAFTETKLEGKSDGSQENSGQISEAPEGQKA
jgi:hypothetical protein